jgi:hypothetical protein
MPDPERYLTVERLRRELATTPEARLLNDEEEDADGMTEYDRVLKEYLDEESARIEGEEYADARFVETTSTSTVFESEAVDGNGKDLVLPNRPLVDVTSIDLLDSDATITVDDVRVRETHLAILDSADVYSWPRGAIEVTYTHGYDEVPGPVVDALVRLVRSRLERRTTDGVESESVPSGQSATYRPPEAIISSVQSTVSQYRPDSYGSSGGAMLI